MRNLKVLSLAAVAAMALMAFIASPASATGGGLYNGATRLVVGARFDFTIPSGGSTLWVDTNNNALDACTGSTIKGELTNAGSATVNPTGPITSLTWTGCTFTTTSLTLGKLQFEWTSGTTGNIKTDATISVTINTVLFGSCIYGVESGKSIGTLTTNSTTTATFDANTTVERLGENIACPPTAKWTGTYTSTEPDNLRIEAS